MAARKPRLKKEEIDEVVAMHARGYSVKEIAEKTDHHRNTVSNVLDKMVPGWREKKAGRARTVRDPGLPAKAKPTETVAPVAVVEPVPTPAPQAPPPAFSVDDVPGLAGALSFYRKFERYFMSSPCLDCGKKNLVWKSQPNLFYRLEPIGYAVLCRACETVYGLAFPGKEDLLEQYLQEARTTVNNL